MITKNEIKINYLNIDTSVEDYDSIIEYYIGIAENRIIEYCNQSISQVTEDVYFECFADFKSLGYNNVTSLNALYELNDGWQEVEAELIYNPRPRIIYDFYGYYKANITYGYTTIPSEIKHVCGEMVYMMFEQSKVNDGALRGTVGVSQIQTSFDGLSGTFAIKDMLPEWKNKLRKYRLL